MAGVNVSLPSTQKKRIQNVQTRSKKREYCFICFAMADLKNINKKFRNRDRVENYANMIQSCFKIQVFEFNEEIRENASICKDCINRLKESCAFLRDIERGQKTLCASKYDKINKPKDEPTSKVTSCLEKVRGGITIKEENLSNNNNDLRRTLEKIEKLTCVLVKKEKTSAKIKKSEDVVKKNENTPAHFVSCDNFCDEGIDSDSNKIKEEKNLVYLMPCDVSFDDGLDSDSNKFNKDNLFEGYQSEGSWSTNTEDIYIATGYYSTNRDIPEKPTKRDRSKEPKGMKKIIPRGCTTCPVCQKEFQRRDYLVIHYAIHAPNDLCYICGKLVTHRSQFSQHLQSHESKRDLYLCAHCSKPFRTKKYMIQHMERIHKNKLLYVCPICSKRFGNSIHKRMHLRDEHGEQIKTHSCQLCSKEFITPASLTRHLEVFHGKEKQFVCTECPKTFCKKQSLLDHMVKHTGIPIHVCHLCGKTFGKRYTLKKHVVTHTNVSET